MGNSSTISTDNASGLNVSDRITFSGINSLNDHLLATVKRFFGVKTYKCSFVISEKKGNTLEVYPSDIKIIDNTVGISIYIRGRCQAIKIRASLLMSIIKIKWRATHDSK